MDKNRKKKLIIILIWVALGTLGGYLYYSFVGCKSGNCRITSNPYWSMLYGAIFGFLLHGLFDPKKKSEEK